MNNIANLAADYYREFAKSVPFSQDTVTDFLGTPLRATLKEAQEVYSSLPDGSLMATSLLGVTLFGGSFLRTFMKRGNYSGISPRRLRNIDFKINISNLAVATIVFGLLFHNGYVGFAPQMEKQVDVLDFDTVFQDPYKFMGTMKDMSKCDTEICTGEILEAISPVLRTFDAIMEVLPRNSTGFEKQGWNTTIFAFRSLKAATGESFYQENARNLFHKTTDFLEAFAKSTLGKRSEKMEFAQRFRKIGDVSSPVREIIENLKEGRGLAAAAKKIGLGAMHDVTRNFLVKRGVPEWLYTAVIRSEGGFLISTFSFLDCLAADRFWKTGFSLFFGGGIVYAQQIAKMIYQLTYYPVFNVFFGIPSKILNSICHNYERTGNASYGFYFFRAVLLAIKAPRFFALTLAKIFMATNFIAVGAVFLSDYFGFPLAEYIELEAAEETSKKIKLLLLEQVMPNVRGILMMIGFAVFHYIMRFNYKEWNRQYNLDEYYPIRENTGGYVTPSQIATFKYVAARRREWTIVKWVCFFAGWIFPWAFPILNEYLVDFNSKYQHVANLNFGEAGTGYYWGISDLYTLPIWIIKN